MGVRDVKEGRYTPHRYTRPHYLWWITGPVPLKGMSGGAGEEELGTTGHLRSEVTSCDSIYRPLKYFVSRDGRRGLVPRGGGCYVGRWDLYTRSLVVNNTIR